ncbi:MAG: hypothetical protein ACRC1H_00320, partial [Caldilineaceae bacterium]
PELLERLREVVLGLSHRVWAGETPRLTLQAVVAEAAAANVLSPDEAGRLLASAEAELPG